MPISLELSDTEILMDMDAVLFHVNLELSKRRIELESRLKNSPLTLSDFRGTILGLENGKLRVKSEAGGEKMFPLTRNRVRQLLAETMTRK